MGSSEEAFCLKWNDFQKSVTSSFAELRRDSNLTDVTIVVEGTHLKAHKVILSACSGAFKELFRSSGISKEPVIMLWDVSAEDMEALFNFMYQGQVNVVQERLNTFLDLAERLRVKGLTNNKSPEEEADPRSSPTVASRSNTPPSSEGRKRSTGASPARNNTSIHNKKPRILNRDESEDSDEKSPDKSLVMIKTEQGKDEPGNSNSEVDGLMEDGDFNHDDYFEATEGRGESTPFAPEDLLQGTSTDFIGSEATKESRHENCSWCNRSFRNLNQHIDDIHLATPTPCPLCGKVFSSKPKMLKHKTLKHHGESARGSSSSSVPPHPQPCNCPYCGKFFDSRQGMNGHTAHCSLRPKGVSPSNNNGLPSESSSNSTVSSNNMGSSPTMAVCPDCGRLFQSKHQMYGHRAHCKARVPPLHKKTILPTTTPPLPARQAALPPPSNQEEGFELLDKGNMIWVE